LLGLLAASAQLDNGLDLRSGCLLIPTVEPVALLLGRTLKDATPLELDTGSLIGAYRLAVSQAAKHGLLFSDTHLTAGKELVKLAQHNQIDEDE
jgi:hypothetical protein